MAKEHTPSKIISQLPLKDAATFVKLEQMKELDDAALNSKEFDRFMDETPAFDVVAPPRAPKTLTAILLADGLHFFNLAYWDEMLGLWHDLDAGRKPRKKRKSAKKGRPPKPVLRRPKKAKSRN